MPTPLEQLIEKLQTKATMLQQRHEYLQKGLESKEAEIRTLRDELDSERRKNSELLQKVEYLQVVHSVAPSRSDVAETRALLTGLVREIDKCIADLSD
ncbi:MAG: hypothetical protein J1E38_08855 [Paramuribaculum sp.]|nr:hypothetical protein [Paramuribaculum sp.]